MIGLSLIPWILIGLALAAGGAVGVAWVFARLWCRPTRTLPGKDPSSLGLEFEAVRIPSRKGPSAHGWFVPGNGLAQRGPALVLVHGWSRNATQLLHLVPPLHERGFSVLLFDARGHGRSDSDGPITIRKFAEDALAAVEYLARRTEVDPDRIGVVGHSIGASSVILAASMDERIRAVVSSSAFADPAVLTGRVFRRLQLPAFPLLPLVQKFVEGWLGTAMEEVSPMRKVGQIAAPLLLIHGEGDRFIPSSDLWILHGRATSQDVQFWLVPKRDHSSVLFHPGVGPRIAGFLTEALASAASMDNSGHAVRLGASEG